MAEFILLISDPEKEDFTQSAIDSITEGGAVTMLVLLSVTSLILGGYFLVRGKDTVDFDWEDDDDF